MDYGLWTRDQGQKNKMKKNAGLILLILFCFAWGRLAHAEPCLVSSFFDFSTGVTQLAKGECETDEPRWLRVVQKYFPQADHVSLLYFNGTMDIYLTSPVVLQGGQTPVLVMALRDATVRWIGLANHEQSTGVSIRGKNVILQNITVRDFSGSGIHVEGDNVILNRLKILHNGEGGGSGLVMTGNHIQVSESEIANNGVNGVIIADKDWTSACSSVHALSNATDIVLRDNNIHHNGTTPWLNKTCAEIEQRLPENGICMGYEKAGQKESPSTFWAGFGLVVDGYQVQVIRSEANKSSIHDNARAGIFLQSYSPAYFCRPNNAVIDPAEILHTLLVSKTSFFENGSDTNKLGIKSVGPLFPKPQGLVGLPGNNGRITVSGNIPLSHSMEDPWRLGPISPKNLQVEIYASRPNDGEQGRTFLGVAENVSASGDFQATLDINEMPLSHDFSLTAVAIDRMLKVSSSFSSLSSRSTAADKADTDGDGLLDFAEDANQNGRVDFGETDPRNPDTDGDGLSDGAEHAMGLDPTNPDTDGDCLPDGVEAGVTKEAVLALRAKSLAPTPFLKLSPQCIEKAMEAGTVKPLNGIWEEGAEETWQNMIGMVDADPSTTTNPASNDTDNDGIHDGDEDKNLNGKREDQETDTAAKMGGQDGKDTDGDGLDDGEEIKLGTDPIKSDSDGDGAPDGVEVNRLRADPNKCDTDGDGLGDGLEASFVNPKAATPECRGLQAAGTNFRKIQNLDPLNPDSDDDGIPDGEEDANHNGWLDFNETDPTIADTDGDGLSDGLEKKLDQDGDGVIDFELIRIANGEKCSPPSDANDLDCDGLSNGRDEDSDNDGCLDSEEATKDSNDDGILDLWQTSVKGCNAPKNSSSAPASSSSAPPASSGSQKENGVRPPEEVLPAKGGGACQLVRTDTFNKNEALNFIWVNGIWLCFIGLLLNISKLHRD